MRLKSKIYQAIALVLTLFMILAIASACNGGVPADKVYLDITGKTLFVGESLELTATSNKRDAHLIWSSDDENIATVSDGKVTAISVGETKINVQSGTAKAVCNIKVIEKPESISLDVDDKTLTVGESFTLNATTASDGVTVIWSSGNVNVATVVNGTVKAISEGSTVITAQYGAVSATCNVTVAKKTEISPEPEYSVQLNYTEKTLYVDETVTLTASTKPVGATVIWSTSNSNVATVKDGLVKAISAGSATITAKYGTASATCIIMVSNKSPQIPDYSISLDMDSKTLTVGDTFTLKAETNDSDAVVTWASLNTKVATVTNGTVKAVSAGTAKITATYGTALAVCIVTVNNKEVEKPDQPLEYAISLDVSAKTLITGDVFTLNATTNNIGGTVIWSTSNSDVATVKDGVVTAVGEGNAHITAKYGTAFAICAITVKEPEVSGEIYSLAFGDKATTCSNSGKWYYMCDGGAYEFASSPEYNNGVVTLALNWVSTDTSKHFQLRIQPEFTVGTQYTVTFNVKLSAAGSVAYGLSTSNTKVNFVTNESKNITCKSTVTQNEPFIVEVLPTVRSSPIVMTVSDIEFAEESAAVTPEPSTLKDKYSEYFPIGTAVQNSTFSTYSEIMKNYNSVTPENDMKWKYLESKEGTYSWTNADNIIKWAKQNGAGVRGHCLVWYKSLPDWLGEKVTDKSTALSYIDKHIEDVMTHFGSGDAKDVIYAWDVCNEALRNSVSATQLANGDIWRTGSEASGDGTVDWFNLCGTDYIKEAFKKADEMRMRLGLDNVKLYYNDYSLNYTSKRAACVQLVKMLQDEGIAIDGVGMQAHYRISNYDGNEQDFLKNFEESIKAFTELGIDVQITELDIRIYENDTVPEKEITSEILEKQGEMYGKILEICRKYSTPWKDGAGRITSLTMWGVSDAKNPWNTTAHNEFPFIFDGNKQPKPAYDAMINF